MLLWVKATLNFDKSTRAFYDLTPHQVMDAVDETGLTPTGEYIQLNSYENRVFEVKLENHPPVIVKLYRPGRWSRETILEEHFFLQELKEAQMPVIAPMEFKKLKDQTLFVHNHMYVTLFPKGLGRMPQELFKDDYIKIGRRLALLHNVGQQKVAKYRPSLKVDEFGYPALDVLVSWVAPEVRTRYFAAAETILEHLDDVLIEENFIRIHGDCHRGNLLQTDPKEGEKTFFFVDFDDFVNGPVAQDFWMLFSGHSESQQELEWLLSGYEELRHFPDEQLELFQPLRGLRIIHYAGWIARRWQDPSFPKLFPQFEDYSYWAEETEILEKIAWNL
ncbi:MAG: serine/threonine protein kinase [Bdellovibrionales bacterium]|nr:serine/threonine protein kinase [Bdellovibrionales bacterium]